MSTPNYQTIEHEKWQPGDEIRYAEGAPWQPVAAIHYGQAINPGVFARRPVLVQLPPQPEPRFYAGKETGQSGSGIYYYAIDDRRANEEDPNNGANWYQRIHVCDYTPALRDRIIELLNRPEDLPRNLRGVANMPAGSIGRIYQSDAKACCDVMDDLRAKLAAMTGDRDRKQRLLIIAEENSKWETANREKLEAANDICQKSLVAQERRHKEEMTAKQIHLATVQNVLRDVVKEREALRTTIREIARDALEREKSLSAQIAALQPVHGVWTPKLPQNLREDIIRAINCRSAESGSDTPDWILGDFLMASLAAFDEAVKDRTRYYAIPDDAPASDPPATTAE